jgi:hypothetical protein
MPSITIPDIKISQTTLNSYLSFGMMICAGLLSQPQLLPPKYSAIVGGILGVLRVISGHYQKDAGTQLAVTPDSPSPKLVPSVEVPVDPNSTPVVKN